MSEHRIGTREEWQAARDALLEREKDLTHRNDELARERRELPWVPVEKEYNFETDGGTKTLPELFVSMRVRPVGDYPNKLLAALRASAPAGIEDPNVVVLTPGA